MDSEELAAAVDYRIAYRITRAAIERETSSTLGSDPVRLLAKLREYVHREMGDRTEARDVIDAGIEDAAVGRRPRW